MSKPTNYRHVKAVTGLGPITYIGVTLWDYCPCCGKYPYFAEALDDNLNRVSTIQQGEFFQIDVDDIHVVSYGRRDNQELLHAYVETAKECRKKGAEAA